MEAATRQHSHCLGRPLNLTATSPPAPGPVNLPVWACVVCYHVRAEALQPLLQSLRPQVGRILLIDNSPGFSPTVAGLADESLTYVPMGSNVGTAGALNEAWRLALAGEACAMISFDQDSLPAPDLVACLMSTWHQLISQGKPVAVIGPGLFDPRSGRPTRILLPVTCRRRHQLPSGSEPIQADHLISSGSLITREAYLAVGPFLNGLFLDYVDIEWSLRARAMGLQAYVQPASAMVHTIGDEIIEFAGRAISVHKPVRSYLLIRNHMLLWRLPTTSFCWLIRDLIQINIKLLVLLLLRPNGVQRWKWVIRGAWHGMLRRDGPPRDRADHRKT